MAITHTVPATNLHEKSVQQKLNAMGLHTSIITPTVADVAAGDVLFVPTEIKNAVASPGGYAILSSILMTDKSGGDFSYDLYFFSSNVGPSPGTGEWAEPVNDPFQDNNEDNLFHLDNFLAVAGLAGGVAYGNDSRVFQVTGLTIPVKAAPGSTSIWVGCEAREDSAQSDGDMKFRFTFLQD